MCFLWIAYALFVVEIELSNVVIWFPAHKKTKVIKAHMLQKPLPRSTETCRPRNMIFKISVHQNDTSGENGHSNNGSSHPVKTREYIQNVELSLVGYL